jgi:hypothetical protein
VTGTSPGPGPATESGDSAGQGTAATGGASCRVRRSYGPSHALAPAQGGGGSPAGPRTRARGDQPGSRHQGAPLRGDTADHRAEREQSPQRSVAPFPGRPPRRRSRNPAERARKLTVRLSETEHGEITAAARRHAVTTARFLATAGLAAARGQARIDPSQHLDAAIDELAALRTALARIGNNLNQIAHHHNAGGQPQPARLDHALAALARALARVDDAASALVKKRF